MNKQDIGENNLPKATVVDVPKNDKPVPQTPRVEPVPISSMPPLPDIRSTIPAPPQKQDKPLPPDSAIVSAVRSLQQNRPDKMLDALKVYDPQTQEYLAHQLHPLIRVAERGLLGISPEESALQAEQLSSALAVMKSKAALTSSTICFCRGGGLIRYSENDFGVPDEAPHSSFKAGQTVYLYVDIKNFSVEPTMLAGKSAYDRQRPGYRVRLNAHWELRDRENRVVFTNQDMRLKELNWERCYYTPPQYYYQIYTIIVPNLPAGAYTLWIEVIDVPTGRTMRRPIELRIAGQS
jgi:hypothetical protein